MEKDTRYMYEWKFGIQQCLQTFFWWGGLPALTDFINILLFL